jgi:hypothetical protein
MPQSNLRGGVARRWQRFRQRTARLRRLPDFVILGAMKSGTTTLYDTLAQHPQVLPCIAKEVHFFDLDYANGLSWYRAHFPVDAYARLRALATGKKVVTGEATPYYLFHPHAPGRLRRVVPHARLIALLRDPVDRAYSHYRHNLVTKEETLTFEDALAAEEGRLRGELDRMRADDSYVSVNYRAYSYVTRGIYVDQLRVYGELFPREQLLVLKAEDYFDDPGAVYSRVLAFLGLGRAVPAGVKLPGPVRHPAVPAAAAQRLRELFRPHNERLYDYLGVDFGWERRAGRRAG